jgi:mannose-1-phosphate guanylyltransferase
MAHVFALIMAGGVGARFWPRSREKYPKQLLPIAGEGTLIQNTIARLDGVVENKNIYIVTNRIQKPPIIKQLPAIPPNNILIEPIGRNTAPCIGLGALFMRRIDPEAVMVVLPADHIIKDVAEFNRLVTTGIQVASETKGLVTIGIKPDRPETGYGYIQVLEEPAEKNPYLSCGVYRVKTFAEKPILQTAVSFLQSGDFVWNSGMFIWRIDVILEEIRIHLPELYQELQRIDAVLGTDKYIPTLEHVYGVLRGISIDYGVMEKARQVYVLKGDIGWSDVGSWDEVYRIAEKDEQGNVILGNVIIKDVNNSIIQSNEKVVGILGVDDLIVINTKDALLICKRGKSQEVKEIVDYLKRKKMNEFL